MEKSACLFKHNSFDTRHRNNISRFIPAKGAIQIQVPFNNDAVLYFSLPRLQGRHTISEWDGRRQEVSHQFEFEYVQYLK